ncbi:hypothetical protein TIFTF001_038770 [Ficus carica]|uniref:Uncharacterized protein n=1 Tax=Ficus carica TaxID=3494 RepID=A0AA88E7W0_FICCA|nr:hypothetical protein TIFTF001_038770 [Ficus carica]
MATGVTCHLYSHWVCDGHRDSVAPLFWVYMTLHTSSLKVDGLKWIHLGHEMIQLERIIDGLPPPSPICCFTVPGFTVGESAGDILPRRDEARSPSQPFLLELVGRVRRHHGGESWDSLPFATRPLYYSSSSSSEITESETLASSIPNSAPALEEEEQLVRKLKSVDVADQEEGVISLRKMTRTKEEFMVSFCTATILLALKPLISSRYAVVQTNTIASLVNLSLEKSNKVTIVRSGFTRT